MSANESGVWALRSGVYESSDGGDNVNYSVDSETAPDDDKDESGSSTGGRGFYRAAIWFKCNAASVGGRAADEDPDPENNWRYKNGVPILQDDGNGISAYSSSRASKAVVRKGIDVGEHNGTIWNYRLGKRMGRQVRDLFWRKPSMLRPFSSIGKIWWTG